MVFAPEIYENMTFWIPIGTGLGAIALNENYEG